MSQVTFKYPQGVKVKCRITGFKGTIVARLQLVNGCVQYSVQPGLFKDDSNYIPDPYNIDEQSLESHDVDGVPISWAPDVVDFMFETGDRVHNRINGFEGIVRTRLQDLNGCERYTIEATLDKDGKQRQMCCFAQELEKFSDGLNAPTERPIEQKRTGGPTTRAERIKP